MLDHLSKELRELYPGQPKPGEQRTYKLATIRKRAVKEGGQSFVIPNSRSLPSNYPIMDDGKLKSMVYVERQIPTNDPNKVQQELGFIEFTANDGGFISVSHDNYAATSLIDMFLFYSPFLTGADKKPWYVKHKLGMFIALENPESLAEMYLTTDQLIHEAKGLVYGFAKPMLGIVIDQLKLGHSARMSEKEMRQKLIQFCDSRDKGQAGGGARRIITLSENKDVALRKLIKTAVAMDKIRIGDSQTEMVWSQGGETICPKLPGKTLEDSMIIFFISNDGREVLGTLRNMIEAVQKGDEKLEDELGPLKGSLGWDKLPPNKKGALNKQRAERDEKIKKDTTIPETPEPVLD